MSELFETTVSGLGAESAVVEAPANYAEFAQDSEPDEPRCLAGLGSVALCATCPMARFLGACPKGVTLEAVNSIGRAETADDVLSDSVEADAGLLLVPVFEPSVREAVLPQVPEAPAETQQATPVASAQSKGDLSTEPRQFESKSELNVPLKDVLKPQTIDTISVEGRTAAAEFAPVVREVVRPLAPQETFLDALFDDSITVISAGMVIEERYETASSVDIQAEPMPVDVPPIMDTLQPTVTSTTQETITAVRPLPESELTGERGTIEAAVPGAFIVGEVAFQVEYDALDSNEELPVEDPVSKVQNKPDLMTYDDIEPSVSAATGDQCHPATEDVEVVIESPTTTQVNIEERHGIAVELPDIEALQEVPWLEDVDFVRGWPYSGAVLNIEQYDPGAPRVVPVVPVVSLADTPEYLKVLTVTPTVAYGALSLAVLGSWAVRLLALRSSLARLA